MEAAISSASFSSSGSWSSLMEDFTTKVSPTLVMSFSLDMRSSMILGDWGAQEPLPMRE